MHNSARHVCSPVTAVPASGLHARLRPERGSGRGHRPFEIEQPDIRAGHSEQCPRCAAAAAAPVASAQQPGCVIAHHWRCDWCDCEWESVFQPLLV